MITRKLTILLVGVLMRASVDVHAAGTDAATSAYATIQPNAAGTHFVYTFSWVAGEDFNTLSDTDFEVTEAGTATAVLDNPLTVLGNYTDLSGFQYWYRSAAAGTSGIHTQYVNAALNTATRTQWMDPVNKTLAAQNPTTATPQWNDVGDFTIRDSVYYGSGVAGVTGIYGIAPSGTDAKVAGALGAAHSGIGVGFDNDADDVNGTQRDDLSFHVSGYDDSGRLEVLGSSPNPVPKTGYLRVLVPYPTSGLFTDAVAPGVYVNNSAIELTVITTPFGDGTGGTYAPKLAVAGDMDSDLDVDAADLTAAATGYAGVGVTGKWYKNGDLDADGDTDNKDLGYVIGAFAAAPYTLPTPTGSATLTYDPANGNVKLDATTAAGSKITSFQLQTAAGTFVPGSYVGPTFGGTKTDVTASVIGNTDTTLAGVTGSAIDLGNVFPTGMDLTQLTAYLTTKVYTGASGSRQQQLALVISARDPGTILMFN